MDNTILFSDDCFDLICEHLKAGVIARMREINPKMLDRVTRCKQTVFRTANPLYRSMARILKPTTKTMILEASSGHYVGLVLETYLAALPMSLTSLEVGELSEYFTKSCVKLLPTTLNDLKLKQLPGWFSDTSFQQLPPNLTRLSASYHRLRGNQVTGGCFEHLPRTMTDLCLHSLGTISEQNIMHLPPFLTRLDLSINKCLRDEFVPLLPRGLVHLNLSHQTMLTSACFVDLPPGLEYLNMNRSKDIDSLSIAKLPRSLKYLLLAAASELDDSATKYLPRSVTYLVFGTANPPLTDKCIIDLPRGLARLHLRGANLSDACIPHLPRQLVQLEIPKSCQSLTDACIKHLPRNLTHLDIPDANQLTAASAIYFPKYLTELSVYDKSVFRETPIASYCHSLLLIVENTTVNYVTRGE